MYFVKLLGGNETQTEKLVITNVMSKIVYSSDQTGSGLVNIEIDGAKFAAGTYIIKLIGGREPKITKVSITH